MGLPIEIPMLDFSKVDYIFDRKKLSNSVLYYREFTKSNTAGISKQPKIKNRRPEIPVWERSSLTIDQAAVYSGVGRDKLRELTDKDDCSFVLWVGSKRLIRRKKLDDYLDKAFSI
ncbi:MAG: excisionase [Acetobacterium sp.]|uniref:excisionase n=1 Tax=Acetobacterium sp. TaxID=1872094 RepID=UPI00324249AC